MIGHRHRIVDRAEPGHERIALIGALPENYAEIAPGGTRGRAEHTQRIDMMGLEEANAPATQTQGLRVIDHLPGCAAVDTAIKPERVRDRGVVRQPGI